MSESELSAEGDTQTPLPAPTDLEVVDVRGDEADVRFEDHADNKRGYRAYVGEDGYLEFDGTGDKVTSQLPEVWSGAFSWTIAFRAELDTAGSRQWMWSYASDAGSKSNAAQHLLINDNDIANWGFWSSRLQVKPDLKPYQDGEIHDFVVRYDHPNATIDAWADGDKIYSVTNSDEAENIDVPAGYDCKLGSTSRQADYRGKVASWHVLQRAVTNQEIIDYANGVELSGPDLLKAYYFNQGSGDTLIDYSGNGNHGTLQNNPTWVGGGDLTQNGGDISPQYGMVFDGQNNTRIRVPDDPSLDFTTQTSWSWWQLATGTDETGSSRVLEKNANDGYGAQINVNANYNLFINKGGDYQWWSVSVNDYLSSVEHFTFTFNSDQSRASVYQNGTEIASRSVSSPFSNTTGHSFNIGNWSGGARPFGGVIGDLRVYDVELTADEVSRLYQGEDITRGLVSNWRPSARFGTVVPDAYGPNDGNVKGGVSPVKPLGPINHTLTGLENGESYVTRASVFTEHEEVFDR